MNDDRPSAQAARRVSSLADLRLAHETLDSVLGHIGRLGVEALEGWDAAGTTLLEGDKVATFGSTDPRINPVDQYQYDHRRGPCVDALAGEAQYFDGDTFDVEWRQFAEVAADHDIYSVLSFPLRLDQEVIGGLNFYSRERDALRAGQREEGLLFAAQAAVTISNMRSFLSVANEVAQLKEALQTRTVIGQATGLLMAQEGMSSEEAFQKLVKVSQNANVTLRDVASRYVAAAEARVKAD